MFGVVSLSLQPYTPTESQLMSSIVMSSKFIGCVAAAAMWAAVKKAGVVNLLCHNYRRVPAVALARRIIDEGQIAGYRFGRVIRLRGHEVEAFINRSRIRPGELEHLYPEPAARADNES